MLPVLCGNAKQALTVPFDQVRGRIRHHHGILLYQQWFTTV